MDLDAQARLQRAGFEARVEVALRLLDERLGLLHPLVRLALLLLQAQLARLLGVAIAGFVLSDEEARRARLDLLELGRRLEELLLGLELVRPGELREGREWTVR